MDKLIVCATIIFKDIPQKSLLNEKLNEEFQDLGYKCNVLSLIKDDSELALLRQKLTKEEMYELTIEVAGINVDYRQVVGGLQIVREAMNNFVVFSIKLK